jgi:hypothetical protein
MIHSALTALAQRELGPGYLVAIRDNHRRETIELHGPGPSLVDAAETVLQVVAKQSISYGEMAASELSVCALRRRALESLVADRLAVAA